MRKILLPLFICTVLTLCACGAASDEGQIKMLVDDMMNAMKNGDLDKLKELAPESAEMYGSQDAKTFKAMMSMVKNLQWQVNEIKISGDTATARIKMSMEMMGQKQENENEATFARINGKWRARK